MYIYLDESGDLGFDFSKSGTSKHFVMAALLTNTPKVIANCIKHVKQRALRKKYKKIPEIKFNNSPPAFRRSVINKLSSQDIAILVFCLNKPAMIKKFPGKKDKLYNYVAGLLFDKILEIVSIDNELILTVDKVKIGRLQVQDFDLYIRLKLSQSNNPNRRLQIIHEDSKKDRCLQAVDFLSGVIFRMYERKDDELFEIVKNKIKKPVFWPR